MPRLCSSLLLSLLISVVFFSCASMSDVEAEKVPLCGSLDKLAPLPDRCAPGELDAFTAALSNEIPPTSRKVVRVALDDAAKVRAVCVDPGHGSGSWSGSWNARSGVAQNLDAIFALPSGPACASGKRLDLNRFGAKLAEIHDREARCQGQVDTSARNQTMVVGSQFYGREFDNCMRYQADFIEVNVPGTTESAIYVKPEIPNPSGPNASETESRCYRKTSNFDALAACIESDGWEVLVAPRR
jgi:hypothetical protein